MAENKSLRKEFTKGLIAENPVLRLALGTCPALAVSTSVINAIGMGISATIVLLCSNIVVSLLRKVIPSKVRIPAYIVIIASFVTIVQMMIKAFVPEIDASLGVFLPLIVVNCIILGRAEAFANKNPVIASVFDGLGMGIGFTVALVLIATVREVLGAGTLLANSQDLLVIFGENALGGFNGFNIAQTFNLTPMVIFILAPGGFFVFGILMALSNKIAQSKGKPKAELRGCDSCPMSGNCSLLVKNDSDTNSKEVQSK